MGIKDTLSRAGVAIFWTCFLIECLRMYRVYHDAQDAHYDKQRALKYSSCSDLSTVSARYDGHIYMCSDIRTDVKVGPLWNTVEQWWDSAWFNPKHPTRHITDNPWALTAMACTTIIVTITSVVSACARPTTAAPHGHIAMPPTLSSAVMYASPSPGLHPLHYRPQYTSISSNRPRRAREFISPPSFTHVAPDVAPAVHKPRRLSRGSIRSSSWRNRHPAV